MKNLEERMQKLMLSQKLMIKKLSKVPHYMLILSHVAIMGKLHPVRILLSALESKMLL